MSGQYLHAISYIITCKITLSVYKRKKRKEFLHKYIKIYDDDNNNNDDDDLYHFL